MAHFCPRPFFPFTFFSLPVVLEHHCHSCFQKSLRETESDAMGLLDKLWDDTLAGPRPDSGLGRLRKFSTFSIRTDLSKDGEGVNGRASGGEESPTDQPRVTRSIMIKRPSGSPSSSSGVSGSSTPPESPAGSSTPPVSPFFGSGGREWNRFRRRSMPDAYDRGGGAASTAPSTPTGGGAAATVFGSRNPSVVPPFDA